MAMDNLSIASLSLTLASFARCFFRSYAAPELGGGMCPRGIVGITVLLFPIPLNLPLFETGGGAGTEGTE